MSFSWRCYQVHREYLEAGAAIISTASYQVTIRKPSGPLPAAACDAFLYASTRAIVTSAIRLVLNNSVGTHSQCSRRNMFS